MGENAATILKALEEGARDGFRRAVQTGPMSPRLAADVVRRLPKAERFDPERVAKHLAKLPAPATEYVRIARSAHQTVLSISFPGSRKAAFEWTDEILETMAAASVKMNLGPSKDTDLKVFWGQPDVNTLIDIGGPED